MNIKVNDEIIELAEAGILPDKNNLEINLVSDKTSEEIERMFNKAEIIELYDGDALLETFKGYTKLLYIRKNILANTYTVYLTQPSITIKGLSNIDEIKTLLEIAGYEITE